MARRRFNIGIIVFCVLLSAALWVYVTLSRVSEDDVEIPLVIEPPANQALLSAVPRTLSVRVRGSGIQILNMKYVNRSAACRIDLSRYQPTTESMYRIDYDDLVRNTTLPSSMRIVATSPDVLELTTGDMVRAIVPVELRYNVTCREGFEIVGTPIIQPTKVEVRGSKVNVDSIARWYTEKLLLDDVYQPIDVTVPVSDSLQSVVNVVPSAINVKIDVQQTAAVTLRQVAVVISPSTTGYRVVPERVSVTIEGGAQVLSDLASQTLTATVPPTATGAVVPTIVVPAGTRLRRIDPPYVRLVRMR